jgi:hypothetical protein
MNDDEFDPDWDQALFTASIPVIKTGESALDVDDWEARYTEDTTGYVPDPLTTSFTDLDLGPALLKLGDRSQWADLDAWSES